MEATLDWATRTVEETVAGMVAVTAVVEKEGELVAVAKAQVMWAVVAVAAAAVATEATMALSTEGRVVVATKLVDPVAETALVGGG